MKRVLLILFGFLLMSSTVLYAQKVTIGNVSFYLAPDYKVEGKMSLSDGDACLIVPKGIRKGKDRLILKINSEELQHVNGLTDGEIKQILFTFVDRNAGVFADKKKSGYKLDQKYQVRFNNNADGTYFPHCYSYLNFTDKEGVHYFSYTEAALVKRTIVCGSAVATDEGELRALTEIFSDIVAAADK